MNHAPIRSPTAARLYIGDVLQAKVSAMGLLAQLFRHKDSPPRESATVPESETETLHPEVRGVGAVAEQLRTADAVKAPAEIIHIPDAAVQSTPAMAVRMSDADELPSDQAPTELQMAPAPAEHPPSEKITDAPAPREHTAATPTISAPPTSEPCNEPQTAAPTPARASEISPPEISPPEIPAPETSAPAVTLPPPAQHEVPPPVFAAATEERKQPRELRPEKDVAISTTLRAVVLGGIAPSGSSDEPLSGGQILAPRITLTATATPIPTVLTPSVIPSATTGSILLAPRTTPDFEALQKLFMTNAALDLAGVASLAAALPGVRACVISGAAGHATAGDFSHSVSAEEMREASANLVRRAAASMETLHRGGSDIVIFLHGETCIAVILTSEDFVPGVRERIARATELLAGTQPVR